jgi:F420-non-reducing hydrogenase iron-sulfur subunit
MRRFKLLKKILAQFGVEEKRVRLEWISASEGERFAQVVNELTHDIRELGPFKFKQDIDLEVKEEVEAGA